jgi:hypothetical protein
MNRRPPVPRRRRLRQGAPLRRAAHERLPLPPGGTPQWPPEPVADVDADAEADADDRLALAALSLENALLARELGRAQERFSAWVDASNRTIAALEAALVRERGANLVHVTREEILRGQLAASQGALARPSPAAPASQARAAAPRVLCVGGRVRQLPVSQTLVERHGGRFMHSEGSGDGLVGLLSACDVVLLHAALLPGDSVRQVELHCRRTGTPCVRIERLCARGFDEALVEALGRWARATAAAPAVEAS